MLGATCWRSRTGRVRAAWMGGEGTPPHRVSHTAERRGERFEEAERLGRTCGILGMGRLNVKPKVVARRLYLLAVLNSGSFLAGLSRIAEVFCRAAQRGGSVPSAERQREANQSSFALHPRKEATCWPS